MGKRPRVLSVVAYTFLALLCVCCILVLIFAPEFSFFDGSPPDQSARLAERQNHKPPSDLAVSSKTLNERIATVEKKMVLVSSVLLLVFMSVVFVLLFLASRRHGILRKSIITNLGRELVEISSLKEYQQGIDKFQREVRNKFEELENKDSSLTTMPPTRPEANPEPEPEKPSTRVFDYSSKSEPLPLRELRLYATRPKKEGFFAQEDLKPEPDYTSVYELRIHDEETEADLYLVNDQKALRAPISFPTDYNLSIACEYDGFPPSKASSIRVVKCGRLKKVENRWEIRTRAKIRFE